VWDYKPSAEKLASESGWREAVEIMPDLVDNREIITTHQIDIDVEPAQIVWSKRELEVDERKSGLESQAKASSRLWSMRRLPRKLTQYPETQYDAAVVDAARIVFEARMDEIAAATTHEAVDAL
jgi:hypothetical protein